jgi:hypothetical protein
MVMKGQSFFLSFSSLSCFWSATGGGRVVRYGMMMRTIVDLRTNAEEENKILQIERDATTMENDGDREK